MTTIESLEVDYLSLFPLIRRLTYLRFFPFNIWRFLAAGRIRFWDARTTAVPLAIGPAIMGKMKLSSKNVMFSGDKPSSGSDMGARYVYKLGRPLKVVTVCGVGQGSSLIMKMFMEDVLKELGVPARIEPTEIVTAKAAGADVIVCSILHEPELRGSAKIVVGLKNLVDKKEMREKITKTLLEAGWLEQVG
ncbi:MAG: PTS sugar transporter subunit IIB [Infirmifilum sp.]